MSPVRATPRAIALATAAAALLISANLASGDELTTLEKAPFGPYGAPTFMVVNSRADWIEQMRKLEQDGGIAFPPGPEAPLDVDWDRECVLLIAAGSTGYDVRLTLDLLADGQLELNAEYSPLGHDGGESLPYHLAKTLKRSWLPTQLREGPDVIAALPQHGPATSVPAVSGSWGWLKARYRRR